MGMFRPFKLFFMLIAIIYSISMYGTDYNHNVQGSIVDNFTNKGLDSVLVTLMANDSTMLSTCMSDEEGFYMFEISKTGKYIIKAERKGYETSFMNCELRSQREFFVAVNCIRMDKVYQLREVTVTSTKIKMVMRGDTIVYNADAFNLPEGSMLDALVSKLPGAKLTKDGEIFVNGKKIESLLVNGNGFFAGNPRVALDNLPAYTVNKIKVYNKDGAASRIMGRDMGDRSYVMDVRLKKEYSTGYLGNLEGGLGSEDRYKLKAIGQRFSERDMVHLYSDINNINLDQRAALGGEETSPQSNPDGRIAKKEFGLQAYRCFDDNILNFISTSNNYCHTGGDLEVKTNGQTFLPTGDSFNRSSSYSTSSSDRLTSNNQFYFQSLFNKRMYADTDLNLSYHHNRGFGSNQSETSDKSSVLNNLLSSNSIESKNLDLYFYNKEGLKVIADMIRAGVGFTYNRNAQKTFTMDDVLYPSGKLPRDYRNNFRDQTHQNFTAFGDASYDYGLRYASIVLEYNYKYTLNKSDNMLYRLDKLSGRDSSQFDMLPSATDALAQVKDDGNSYLFHEYRNEHTIKLRGNEIPVKFLAATAKFEMPIHFVNANLYYDRMGRHHVRKAEAFFNPSLNIRRWKEHWTWTFDASMGSELPDLTNMVNYQDDSDPLNIRLGNSTLRNIHYYNTNVSVEYRGSRQRMGNIYIGYQQTDNAVAYGLTFDKNTGVSIVKPQSVNGNWRANFSMGYTQAIDNVHKWSVDNHLSAGYNHNVDLATVEGYTDSRSSIVHNYRLDDNIKLNFRPDDRNEICLHAGGTYYLIKGECSGFEDIKAGDYRIGMNAQVALPWKFNLTTDMTMYARRGYQSSDMNTTDWVWNAQITRSFLNGRLISKLSGFDILHQLSNTQYAVNAQGRTETWHNSIPRYVMLSLAWSFNVNPGK